MPKVQHPKLIFFCQLGGTILPDEFSGTFEREVFVVSIKIQSKIHTSGLDIQKENTVVLIFQAIYT